MGSALSKLQHKRAGFVIMGMGLLDLIIPGLPHRSWHLYYWAGALVLEGCVVWWMWPFDRDERG